MIDSIFPLKGQVTRKIIIDAHVFNPLSCIGALTLKAALGDNVNLFKLLVWGSDISYNSLLDGTSVIIRSKTESGDSICMMNIKKPTTVYFHLEYNNKI